jgi:glycosyltransferase involved in cell wall biosynthesis
MRESEVLSMRPKRILLVDLGVPFGGVEVYLASLARLLEGGAELYALCVNPELAGLLAERGVHVFALGFALHRGKFLQILLGALSLPYLRLRYGVNTVWINGYTEIVLLPWARLLGCTAMATRHLTLDPQMPGWHLAPNRAVARVLYRHLAFVAHKIICVSGAVAEDLATIVSPSKLVVIRNWVPVLPDLVKTPKTDGEPLKLLFVGRLQKYKGVSIVIDAMHRLKEQGKNHAVSLTVVGEGEFLEELKHQAEGLDVRFVGFQRDTSQFYRDADVFVNPSAGPEGLPLVSLEAMSYGLPCIFSDLTVHREITDDGECALLFRSQDAGDLCAKIDVLLASRELMVRYGELAREMINLHHSPAVARASYFKELGIALTDQSSTRPSLTPAVQKTDAERVA